MSAIIRGQAWRLQSGFPSGVEDLGQYYPPVYQWAAANPLTEPQTVLEEVAEAALAHVAGEGPSGSDKGDEVEESETV
jgi:hypothetical protein